MTTIIVVAIGLVVLAGMAGQRRATMVPSRVRRAPTASDDE
jgi:hypothetical protein